IRMPESITAPSSRTSASMPRPTSCSRNVGSRRSANAAPSPTRIAQAARMSAKAIRPSPRSRHDPVADPPHRLQVAGSGGVVLDLLAQPANVHRHGARVEGCLVSPHAVHELIAGEDLAGVAPHEPEQVELPRREPDRCPGAGHLAGGRLHLDVAE